MALGRDSAPDPRAPASDDRRFGSDRHNAPPEHRPSAADLARARQPHRGRQATRPGAIPQPGWKDILLRVKREIAEDQLSLVAAGVAFYFMLALFPGLLAVVAIFGVVSDPATVGQQMTKLMTVMPADAAKLVGTQLQQITSTHGGTAGFGAALAILIALWSASNGAQALISGLNIAYDEEERRGFFALRAVALLLTIGFVGFVTVSLGVIAALPPMLERLPLGPVGKVFAYGVTWTVMGSLVTAAFAAAYRFGPSREHARWKWLSLGSVVGATLWLVASLGFSFYASHFGRFNRTYGTLTGAILLLVWLQISAYVTLLGAELNSEVEHQTARDTTTGAERPMGERDATVADTVGEAMGAGEREDSDRRRPFGRRGDQRDRQGKTASWQGSGPH